MGRLIDADALIPALFEKHVHDGEELEPMLYYADAVKVIENAPTVDAIPVVHGRWETVTLHSTDFVYYVSTNCSVCGEYPASRCWKYCPNCGAKMDGERRDDDATGG